MKKRNVEGEPNIYKEKESSEQKEEINIETEVREMTEDQISEVCNEICLKAESTEDAESKIKDRLGLKATVVFMGNDKYIPRRGEDVPEEDRMFTGTVEHPRKKGWVISFNHPE